MFFDLMSQGFISLATALVAQISAIHQKVREVTLFRTSARSQGALLWISIAGAIVSAQSRSYRGLQLFCGVTIAGELAHCSCRVSLTTRSLM
jgi:hypothetical protein